MEFAGWEHCFDSRILKRGKDYFRSGCVDDLSVKDGEADADVYGSKWYRVRIQWEGGALSGMRCTCPYDGACKHCAAVLYAMQAVRSPAGTKRPSNLERLVQTADEKFVREFLFAAMKDNALLAARFRNSLLPENKEVDIESYMKRIRRIAAGCSDDYGVLDYGYLSDHMGEIDDILEKDIPLLLGNGHPLGASELVTQIFGTFTDFSDEEGDLHDIADSCMKAVKRILGAGDAEAVKFLFDWCVSMIESDLDEKSTAMYDAVSELFDEQFSDGDIAEEKLAYVKGRAEAGASGWMTQYLDTLLSRRTPWNEIAGYCLERLQDSTVRDWYADSCIAKRKYGEAIRILELGCDFEKENSYRMTGCKQKLKDLYAQQGDTANMVQTLWWLVENGSYGVSYLKLLKELRPQYDGGSWERERERIFAKATGIGLCDLYQEEGLTDRLLGEVRKLARVEDIVRYAPSLPAASAVLLDRCEELLRGELKAADNRRKYAELVGRLRLLKRLDGGKARVARLVSEWTVRFRRKSALLEELGKAM